MTHDFSFQVLIVVTDGYTTSGIASLRAPTKRLKDSSVNIISIGVGAKVNKAELELMATTPINSHVFYVNQMDQLKDLISSITTSSCSCEYYLHHFKPRVVLLSIISLFNGCALDASVVPILKCLMTSHTLAKPCISFIKYSRQSIQSS